MAGRLTEIQEVFSCNSDQLAQEERCGGSRKSVYMVFFSRECSISNDPLTVINERHVFSTIN